MTTQDVATRRALIERRQEIGRAMYEIGRASLVMAHQYFRAAKAARASALATIETLEGQSHE